MTDDNSAADTEAEVNKLTMRVNFRHICAVAIGTLLLATSGFSAPTYTFQTPAGSTAKGESVAAQATFTVNQGNLDVTVSNLETPISNAGQVLGDIVFSLSTGLSSPTLSSSGTEVWIGDSGTITNTVNGASAGWALGTTGAGSFTLCDICGSMTPLVARTDVKAEETIIPLQSSYTSANPSIKGNSGHNGFLTGPVTFTITDASINSLTTVSNVEFSFSTQADVEVAGVPTTISPEPMSFALTGTGLALVLAAMLRRRKAVAECA